MGSGCSARRGTGACELFGVEQDVDLRMGTFSKSLASCGGFIAGLGRGDRLPPDLLARRSSSPPRRSRRRSAAALEAVRICRSAEGPELFARVLENAALPPCRTARARLPRRRAHPLPGGGEVITPIVPIVIGDDLTTAQLWKALWDEGLYTNVALYPAVPPGGSLIRTSVMATHEREHLDRAWRSSAGGQATGTQWRDPSAGSPADG